MANPVYDQLQTAERLLAEIQHNWAGVPPTLVNKIRDYFSNNERSIALREAEYEHALADPDADY